MESNDNSSSSWSSREDNNGNACCSDIKGKTSECRSMVSREIRTNNVRTGFESIDLATNSTDILASITGNGPKIGKYFVNLSGCRFAAKLLINALITSEVIICDEIGPMELKSKEFVDVMKNLLKTNKKSDCYASETLWYFIRRVQKKILVR